ncbi:MAG: beta-lactamase family protein [Salinibacterium sp.]|nr:beta-lactamase family protein [Salinibacterium sp.]
MRRPVSGSAGALGGSDASLHHCADSAAAFRRVVAEFQSRQQNVAISVGVRERGRTVFREATGFANKETGLSASPSMAFSIASISKAFTGAALLKLVESGRIDLDAEVQRYVPDFPRHPSGRPVTIRLLAHHLSGLRHWGPERSEALYARHFTDVLEILSLFKDSAWVAGLSPSTRYSYSSYGYNALAMAIQNASGVSFQQYLSQSVLEPLELRSVPAGLLSPSSIAQVWARPSVEGIESPMSFGWFPRTNPPRISISGSNAGVQAGLTVWKNEELVVAVLANSWGRGSRSGELMDDGKNGLIGKLAEVCGAQ